MKKIKMGLILVTMIFGLNAKAQITSSDYIRELFNQARIAASAQVSSIQNCSFDPQVTSSVQNWILKNQGSLEADIRLSKHMWVVDSQPTCAFTNHSSQSPVYLSYPTCNNTSFSLNAAIFTLIHESAHHLGVEDEKQADAIAMALMNASNIVKCPSSGVYDSNICSGPTMDEYNAKRVLSPGTNTKVLGNYKINTRSRNCNMASGCGDWYETQFGIYKNGFSISPTAALNIKSKNTEPFYEFEVNGVNESRVLMNHFSAEDLNFTLAKKWQSQYSYPYLALLMPDGSKVTSENLDFSLKGQVKNNCFWTSGTRRDLVSNGVYREDQMVIYGTF